LLYLERAWPGNVTKHQSSDKSKLKGLRWLLLTFRDPSMGAAALETKRQSDAVSTNSLSARGFCLDQ